MYMAAVDASGHKSLCHDHGLMIESDATFEIS